MNLVVCLKQKHLRKLLDTQFKCISRITLILIFEYTHYFQYTFLCAGKPLRRPNIKWHRHLLDVLNKF